MFRILSELVYGNQQQNAVSNLSLEQRLQAIHFNSHEVPEELLHIIQHEHKQRTNPAAKTNNANHDRLVAIGFDVENKIPGKFCDAISFNMMNKPMYLNPPMKKVQAVNHSNE